MDLLTDLGFGMVFVLCATALSLGTYLLTRRLVGPGPHDHHKEMASAMIARIAALHGLIIALVFAQEMAAYQRLESQTAAEASAIADVYNDARRYDAVALLPLQQTMADYLRIVLDTEWAALGEGTGLNDGAWAAWESAYDTVLDLEPQSDRQSSLREHMLTALHAIAASRSVREAEAGMSFASYFWIAALSGVVLLAVGHYIYPPQRQNLVLMALFSAYTGAILFLIFGFSNPYSPPAALRPAALQSLADDLAQPS